MAVRKVACGRSEHATTPPPTGSGEGRVGEEGRSPWAPGHLKKKKEIVNHAKHSSLPNQHFDDHLFATLVRRYVLARCLSLHRSSLAQPTPAPSFASTIVTNSPF